MIEILKDLYSKLLKKSNKNKASFSFAIDEEGEIEIVGDFDKDYPELLIGLLSTIVSGEALEHMFAIVHQKYDEDEEITEEIMQAVYNIVSQCNNENDDNDCPLVDPCNVFRKKEECNEDETD